MRTDDRRFSLSPRVLELGYAYLSSISLPEVAEPHLERLVAEVRESSSVSVLDGEDVVYVARVPVSRIMTVVDQRRHAVPRLRHLDGPGAARRAGRPTSWTPTSSASSSRGSRRAPSRRTQDLRAELDRVRVAGLGDRRPGARGGPALGGGADPRPAGRVIAAVNCSAHASRRTIAAMRRDMLPPLLATAARIEADLASADAAQRPMAGGA